MVFHIFDRTEDVLMRFCRLYVREHRNSMIDAFAFLLIFSLPFDISWYDKEEYDEWKRFERDVKYVKFRSQH